MIYVTGDTHGSCGYDYEKLRTFAHDHPTLTKRDYVIIAGDWGGLWSPRTKKRDLDAYSRLPFTTLFLDGNHENYDMLAAYPTEEWNGGRVQIIRNDIIHLMRGQVYTIDGIRIFTFGGAQSVDRKFRVEGESWWMGEIPTLTEVSEGLANLARHNNRVDYVITHACDRFTLLHPAMMRTPHYRRKLKSIEPDFLSQLDEVLTYRHWYFGHYHDDIPNVRPGHTLLYHSFVKLEP